VHVFLIDRVGRRKMMMGGSAVCCLMMMLAAILIQNGGKAPSIAGASAEMSNMLLEDVDFLFEHEGITAGVWAYIRSRGQMRHIGDISTEHDGRNVQEVMHVEDDKRNSA